MKIIISRTDKIGDVILTLPLAGVIKKYLPSSTVHFLGRSYTEAIISSSAYVDHFINWDEIKGKESPLEDYKNVDAIIHVFPNKNIAKAAKKAGISMRIGTNHRLYHLFTCNRLLSLSRKNSDLHEAQLNLKLLKPLGIQEDLSLDDIPGFYGWKNASSPSPAFLPFLSKEKFNLIFHMKSMGSAREWPAGYYLQLAQTLSGRFNIILTGTVEEGRVIKLECPTIFKLPHIKNACGKFSLKEFIHFIECTDGLLACSTGPLHIAAASGIYALGLYPTTRPMHIGRWGAIGEKAFCLEENKINNRPVSSNKYLDTISPDQVYEIINSWDKSN